jgi:hypothetical protein
MKFLVLRKTLDSTKQYYGTDRAYLSLGDEALGSIIIFNSYIYDDYKYLT